MKFHKQNDDGKKGVGVQKGNGNIRLFCLSEEFFNLFISEVSGSVVTVVSFFSRFLSQNDVSEKEQRWGAKTVQGSGHQEHIK